MSSNLGQLPQPSSNHHRRCLGQLAVTVVQYNQLVQVLLRLSRRVGGGGVRERSGCSKKQHCSNKPITQTHWLVPTSSDHLQGSGPSISSPLSLSAPPHLLLLLEERQTTPLLLCVLVFFAPGKIVNLAKVQMARQGCVLLGCASAGIWFVAEKLLKVVYWWTRGCLLNSFAFAQEYYFQACDYIPVSNPPGPPVGSFLPYNNSQLVANDT